jgi:hypothetical protein
MLNGFQDPDSSGLRFDSHDDALNFINKLVQDGNNFLAVKKLNFVERYKKGGLKIHIEVTTIGDPSKYHLVFSAIPSRCGPDVNSQSKPAGLNESVSGYYRPEDSVLISAAKTVQCPQEIVPSFVWLQLTNDVRNLLREIRESSFRQGALKFFEAASDRKVGSICGDSDQRKHGVGSLIQSCPDVDRGIAGVTPQSPWERLKLELQKVVDVLIVGLNDQGANVLIVKEGVDFSIEFGNVILSPCDAEF